MEQGTADFDATMAARSEPTTELRGECPRWIVNVLDAVAAARGGVSANVHRTTVLVEVLEEWAKGKRHEAMLIHRIVEGNPTGSDAHGGRQ